MTELKDLFTIYYGLDIPRKKEPKITPPFNRMDLINHYIDSKLFNKEKEKISEEYDIKHKLAKEDPVIEESVIEEPIIEEPVVKQVSSKYSRMRDYVSNKTPLETVMNFFINKGLSAEQAAGFAGNFLSESELSPTAINQVEKKKGYKGYGRGIAQWSNDRVSQFQKYIGKKIEDASLEEQLEFVWYEVQNRPELLRQLYAAADPDTAADVVYRGFENGGRNKLATPQELTESYGESWKKLELGEYDFNYELLKRQNNASEALKNYQSKQYGKSNS